MTLSLPDEAVVGHSDDVSVCFEATGADVFAALCRVTVGDLVASERLLVDTYRLAARQRAADPRARFDRDTLISMAIAAYLDEPATAAGTAGDATPSMLDPVEVGWSQARWAPTLEALRGLDRRSRAVLELVEVEGRPTAAVATLLGTTADEVIDSCADARAHLAEALVTEPARHAFAHAELWLDDALRDRVRRGITGRPGRSNDDRTHRARAVRSPVTRARATALIGGGLVAVLAVVGLRWLETAPNGERGVGRPIAAAPPTTAKPLVNVGDVVEAAPVLDLQLAGDLSDQAAVSLDRIVRYPSSQAVGVSWTGPCNRPAARVIFTQAANGIGVELRTGAFPVVSCVGMPRRWTLVVEEYLGDGLILPVVDGHLDHTFKGASVDHTDEGQNMPGQLYGSALIDESNRPWLYPGRNCGQFGFLRRQSPDGPMFEVRTGLVDNTPNATGQAVGSVSCVAMAIPRVLYGPNGSVFPQTDLATGRRIDADPAAPRDCHGPFGSATDVPSERPFMTQFFDGDWSTWDGCLVRSDVIFTRHLSAACGWGTVQTTTVADTIGDRLGPVQRTHVYVRDPDRVLSREIPPLLHYDHVPGRGIDSGLRFGTDQLWYSPSSPDAIYVVTATDVERWPLLKNVPTCES